MTAKWRFETQAVQGGYQPNPKEPRVLPIVQSTTFFYNDADMVARLFDLQEEGFFYSRLANPTVDAAEKKAALMEGGVGAMGTASGQSATTLALLTICQCGDHFISTSAIYGGTYALFANTFKKLGIEVTFVEVDASPEEILQAARSNTKAIFTETIANPGMDVLDFAKFKSAAQQLGVPLIVDNTLASPFLCRPFEHGANIVVHSTSKYMDGHATSLGGMVVDGGNFDWGNGKFPDFVDPDAAYHGLSYAKDVGQAAFIVKARVQMMRDMGNMMSPFNAYLLNMNLESLGLRMERHSSNALALAAYLEKHPQISWVNYPKLPSHRSYELAEKYLPSGASGVLTFGLKGGLEVCRRFQNSVKLAALVVHFGDTRTSVLHPATTTHRQLSEAEQISAGVLPDLIRVSVGIEHIDDIIADFDQAIKTSLQ